MVEAASSSFNRTIVELKYEIHLLCFVRLETFNRTIVELK